MREMAEANKKTRKKTRLANAGSRKMGDLRNLRSMGEGVRVEMEVVLIIWRG